MGFKQDLLIDQYIPKNGKAGSGAYRERKFQSKINIIPSEI
jgi:hypothetical protein